MKKNNYKAIKLKNERLVVNDFKNRVRSSILWNSVIIELNERLLEVDYLLEGISAIRYDKDDISVLYSPRELSMHRANLYDKRNDIIEERKKYENYLEELSLEFNKLDKDIQGLVVDVYILGKNMTELAKARFYTQQGLSRKIDKNILKVVENPLFNTPKKSDIIKVGNYREITQTL